MGREGKKPFKVGLKQIIYSRIEPSDAQPFLVRFMIRHKIARNDWEAMLVIFAVIIVSVSLFVVFIDYVWRSDDNYAGGPNINIIDDENTK
ncbi:MAG TPA: hypothetical protein VJI33_04035 [Candidatus Paceibacterota bacterium]